METCAAVPALELRLVLFGTVTQTSMVLEPVSSGGRDERDGLPWTGASIPATGGERVVADFQLRDLFLREMHFRNKRGRCPSQ